MSILQKLEVLFEVLTPAKGTISGDGLSLHIFKDADWGSRQSNYMMRIYIDDPKHGDLVYGDTIEELLDNGIQRAIHVLEARKAQHRAEADRNAQDDAESDRRIVKLLERLSLK